MPAAKLRSVLIWTLLLISVVVDRAEAILDSEKAAQYVLAMVWLVSGTLLARIVLG